MLIPTVLIAAGLQPEQQILAALVRSLALEWRDAAPFMCVELVNPPEGPRSPFWHIRVRGEDPPSAVLPPPIRGQPEVVPRSACSVGADYDGPIVLRRNQRGGGATVSMGPVRHTGPDEAYVTVLTWGGGLTHTFQECRAQRKGKGWAAQGCRITLQE